MPSGLQSKAIRWASFETPQAGTAKIGDPFTGLRKVQRAGTPHPTDNPVQQPFTVACWIKTTENGELVTWGSADGGPVGGQYCSFRLQDGRLRAEHGNGFEAAVVERLIDQVFRGERQTPPVRANRLELQPALPLVIVPPTLPLAHHAPLHSPSAWLQG